MSNQNSIIAADAEAAELDATRAVYEMLKPLRCEAQTRVLDHVYALLRTARQRQLSEAQEQEEISRQHEGRSQMTSSGRVSDPVTLRLTWKESLYTALVVFVVLGAILS